MARESTQDMIDRWMKLDALQKAFPNTVSGLLAFAQVVIHTLIIGNPDLNRVQADILRFLFCGSKYRMVQAQRGQAKTTITAIYAVFRLIHEPHYRIVIFSQNARRSKEIAGWVIKIMNGLDFLEFMRPDKYAGDKSSLTDGYDIHNTLKGADKSPSVAAYSIEAGAQGARADLIIADDIESLQNSRTAAGRELLEDASKEFESINQYGDIIYLGTPQSINSIYNNLPSRGYEVRIWTGRYPNAEQLTSYGPFLAPMLRQDLEDNPSLGTGVGLDGRAGHPTCPEMFDDEALIEKEISQGAAKFQLQFMLNTRLSDADRYPLRLCDLMVYGFSHEQGPVMPIWNNDPLNRIQNAPRFGNRDTDAFYRPITKPYEWTKFDRKVTFIDPAGGGRNGDETGVATVGLIGTYIYIIDVFGVKGGYEPETLEYIVSRVKDTGSKEVFIEKNFGYGAFTSVIRPFFEKLWPVSIDDENAYAIGQKEQRIVDTIEPLMKAHRIVVNASLLQEDWDSVQKYPTELRMAYSLFAQMSLVTREKNALKHDDRLDALYGAIAQIAAQVDYDEMAHRAREQLEETKRYLDAWNDPIKRREWLTGVSDGVGAPSHNVMDSWLHRV